MFGHDPVIRRENGFEPGALFVGHRTGDQFRQVDHLRKRIVKIGRVFLREQKRLVRLALGIEVREIRTGQEPIPALAAEDEPTSVAGPGVKTLGTIAVDRVQPLMLFGPQVHQVQVTFRLCPWETAVGEHAEEEVVSVR